MRRLSHGTVETPRAKALAQRFRPWALPVATVIIAYWLFGGGGRFDAAALRRDFRDGKPEAALDLLQSAAATELPAELAGMNWWPKSVRARKLSDLAAVPEAELLEDAHEPTFLGPLDKLLNAPVGVRLREAPSGPLTFQLKNTDMNLDVGTEAVPAGRDRVALAMPLLRGSSYLMTLSDPVDDAQRALCGFTWVSEPVAQHLVRAMTAAHDLAGDNHEGASLMSALVALQCGFTGEALDRLEPLRSKPGYERLATELSALALERQGLDLSARRLLSE